ncbi:MULTISPECIES: hypothetical protein [unclassified Mycobacterium]|uniref:hypothetical protein n=1 Tax=unclassified Mycobacterium TaxID=2642494 RepID=UPI0029C98F80|nr:MULTISPECIES: hypothetical protein [unclassified Mycobacterium]
MARSGTAERHVQYGIQTPNSNTILMVTEDLAEAEHMLDMVGEGRLTVRTISYGRWRVLDADRAAG